MKARSTCLPTWRISSRTPGNLTTWSNSGCVLGIIERIGRGGNRHLLNQTNMNIKLEFAVFESGTPGETGRNSVASSGSTTPRSVITQAINDTLQEYLKAGRIKCARDVGTGHCEVFAKDVLDHLGRPMDVSVIEYENFTGPPDADEGDEIFYDDALLKSGVKLPPGVTADALNASGLGMLGMHVFLRWESPGGPIFFDSEVPEGVDSPFSLPFAQAHLLAGPRINYALKVVKHTIQSVGKPIVEVPAGWTREIDVEEFMKCMEALVPQGETLLALLSAAPGREGEDRQKLVEAYQKGDPYVTAVGGIGFERDLLVGFLQQLLRDYYQPPEADFDVLGEAENRLNPNAKADLLNSALQKRLPDKTLFARVEGSISWVKAASDLCDDVFTRYVLE